MSTALLRVRLFSFYLSRERVSPRPPPAHLALHPVSRPAAFVLVAYVACTKERGRTRPCHRARAILVVVSDDRGDHGGDSRCMTSHADVSSTHAPPNDISRNSNRKNISLMLYLRFRYHLAQSKPPRAFQRVSSRSRPCISSVSRHSILKLVFAL